MLPMSYRLSGPVLTGAPLKSYGLKIKFVSNELLIFFFQYKEYRKEGKLTKISPELAATE
jgi:hypothetical protein